MASNVIQTANEKSCAGSDSIQCGGFMSGSFQSAKFVLV